MMPCVCLTMLRSISMQLKPAKCSHLHRRSNQLSHQRRSSITLPTKLAKLAELNTQVDEDEFKSAISRALSRAGAHVSVEHQERGRPHVHMLITLPWRFSDGSEPRLYDGPSVS